METYRIIDILHACQETAYITDSEATPLGSPGGNIKHRIRPQHIAGAICLALCSVMVVGPAISGAAHAAERILGLRLNDHSVKTRIVLDLSGKLPYSLFTLADPYRIVIDLPEIEWSAASQSANSNGGLVSGYRFGLFQPGNSRFVVDLGQPARITGTFYMDPPPGTKGAKPGAGRLVIDLERTDREGFLKTAGFRGRNSPSLAGQTAPAKPVPAIQAAPPAKSPAHAAIAPVSHPKSEGNIAALMPSPNPRRSPKPPVSEVAAASPALKPLAADLAASRQLRVIVIDAGHGGVDPGAITEHGVYEKSIVLDVAKRLQSLLSQDKRYKVAMTRDSDIFVRLGDRVGIARTSEADLFVSIHADALATRKVRGASVYTLSEQASDKEAELLAAKENNSDMIAGIGIGDETDELVKSILIDLAQRETANKSVHFAKLLLPELNDAGALLKNSHRYAGFRVLKAPDVPSVLVELGLLSNTTDARVLTSNAGRQRLAEALKAAINTYFRDLET